MTNAHEVEPEVEGEEIEHPVTPLELFFDLVFVFALTQVTAVMSDDPTWAGIGRGLLVLAALWWAWGAYAWLTNEIDPQEGSARLAMLGSMAAMFVAALAVPGAFGDDGVLFGIAYFAVRLLHIVLFAEAAPHVDVRQAAFRLARTAIPAPALLVVAGFLDGEAQIALWLVALAIDYGGPLVFGVRGFSVSAEHFAERYALIVIIALGESIVAIGITASSFELDLAHGTAIAVAFLSSAALWWLYFDYVAVIAQRRLELSDDPGRLARDAYTYLHIPLIAGIIVTAVGDELVIAHPTEGLSGAELATVAGGPALYLLGHVGFRWRMTGTPSIKRLLAAAGCVVAGLLGAVVPALAAAGLVLAVLVGLIAAERIAGIRRRRRGEPSPLERLEASARAEARS